MLHWSSLHAAWFPLLFVRRFRHFAHALIILSVSVDWVGSVMGELMVHRQCNVVAFVHGRFRRFPVSSSHGLVVAVLMPRFGREICRSEMTRLDPGGAKSQQTKREQSTMV
jgi:hypothetical protein